MTFLELHRPGDPFVLANAWDLGSARLLAAMGAKAIATSSAGYAFTRGVADTQIGRSEAIAHGRAVVEAVSVPVSADLEDGYGPTPEDCATTVREAAEAGLAGCCIEDVSAAREAYGFDLAVDRMRAAVEAAPPNFVFCARTDGVMHGLYDLDEAIRRLQAFQAVGAHVLYCPFPGDPEDLRRLVGSVAAPVNALCSGPLARLSLAEMGAMGVARVSLGGALARAAQKVAMEAGAAALAGDFTQLGGPGAEIDALVAKGAG
ncbi:isocitrate lyase/PEP mutase family protein [Jannaschia seohaensis]|uniref:2-Methylisocitrate lyase, PEP mutase family n=1 Tax=Jannaschia seohaensis TaxID=475081 RepID=A0A2Y9AMH0_9RHOB|nr:isocitrate lyase/phosphoenolpyruvate mutase family protein [Jannaschia seohaensis]PWJ20462.1 2-methylisocitrate lyase-like PEP mutase family enzyme [Jannaschia seohaensis]SSA44558.1 2-Methylisocitrate lyase, PEP mutase family [Jannaschia seohaensis]